MSTDGMRPRFQPLRAAQAAGVLLRLAGGRLNYTKTLKLLYLADRRSLLETGTTITGDRMVNMSNGPVLSGVYDCIKDEAPSCTTWNAKFKTEKYNLVCLSDPGDSELSDYDVEVLTEVFNTHKRRDYSAMIDFVHDLPEWQDPSPRRMSPLDYADVLSAAGAALELVELYERMSESARAVDAVRVVRA